jgi:uncharacterized membrane protein
MIIVFILIIILIFIYFFNYKELFIICDNIPSGPYITKCNNIHFNNNELYALCPNRELDNKFITSKLNLNNCNDNCNNINIDHRGTLVCN